MATVRIKSQQLLWLGICAAGVIAFLLLFVYPNMLAMRELDEEAVMLAEKVQAQELLHPIYLALIRQVQQRVPEQLPLPETTRMEGTPISDIHVIFAAMAEAHRVAFDSAVPDPVSYMEENAQLTMNVTFSGDFFQFRPLLLRLCELPYLSAIETVRIRTEGDTRRMQLKLVLNQM